MSHVASMGGVLRPPAPSITKDPPDAPMADALLRQWIVLSAIPRHPRRITARELHEKVRAEGIEVTRRTLERDLDNLSRRFPLVVDDCSRPYGWSWAQDSAPLDIPGMDPETALTFKVLEQFGAKMLPRHTLDRLAPHFTRADEVLEALAPDAGLRIWPDRVRILPRGLQLMEPTLDPDVVSRVYQALLERRCFDLRYFSRTHDREQSYLVHPLGLLLRDQVIYLVCTLWDYQDLIQLALHRMRQVELRDEPAREPEGFDLDRYIRDGDFTYEAGECIRLEARFAREAAFHLHETPLSDDQLLEDDGEQVRVTATVLDSQPLRWWLRAFGPQVEVRGPEALRRDMADEARQLAEAYLAHGPVE